MVNRKIEKAGAVMRLLLCIMLIPIILLNLTIIISSYLYPDEIPGAFGIKPVAVLSGSMEDTFREGDLIFIEKIGHLQFHVGDVICYLDSGQAVTHRIAHIITGKNGSHAYVTKGDANPISDHNPVKPEQIQGVWTGARLPNMGKFVMFLSTTTGMILFVVCPILILIAWDMLHRIRQDRTEKKRMKELEAQLKNLTSR